MYRSRNESASRNSVLYGNCLPVDTDRLDVSPTWTAPSPPSPGIVTPRRIVRTLAASSPTTQLVQLDASLRRPSSHTSFGTQLSEYVVDDLVSETVSLTSGSEGRPVTSGPGLSMRDHMISSFCVRSIKTPTPSLERMTDGRGSVSTSSFYSLSPSENYTSSSRDFTRTFDMESVRSCSISCAMDTRQCSLGMGRRVSTMGMNSSIAIESSMRGSEVGGKRRVASRCSSIVADVMQRKAIVNVRREERIGRGSYGDVFRGVDLDTGLSLAVKEIVVTADITKDVELQLLALEREVRVMRKLNNEHIISYYSARRDKASSALLIYMEYISGGTVAQKLKKNGPFCEDETRHYTRQLLKGLDYLHQRHIVHRDLKGDNLFLTEDDVLKVGDFGTSKELQTTLVTDSVAGTPNFMAPEVIACSGHSCMADIWSVGCCVLEMLTGHPPFWDLDNHMAVMFAIMRGRLEEQVPSHISEEAKDFIRRCTCSNPAERPAAWQLLQHHWLTSSETEFTLSSTQSCFSLLSVDMIGERMDTGYHAQIPSQTPMSSNDGFQNNLAAVVAIIPEGGKRINQRIPRDIKRGTEQKERGMTSIQTKPHAPMTKGNNNMNTTEHTRSDQSDGRGGSKQTGRSSSNATTTTTKMRTGTKKRMPRLGVA